MITSNHQPCRLRCPNVVIALLLVVLCAGCSSTRGRFEYPSDWKWTFEQGHSRALDCVGDDSRIKYATGFAHEPVEIKHGQGLIRNPANPNDQRLRPAWFVESYKGHIQLHLAIQRHPDGSINYDAMIDSAEHEWGHGMIGETGHSKQFRDCLPNWRDS